MTIKQNQKKSIEKRVDNLLSQFKKDPEKGRHFLKLASKIIKSDLRDYVLNQSSFNDVSNGLAQSLYFMKFGRTIYALTNRDRFYGNHAGAFITTDKKLLLFDGYKSGMFSKFEGNGAGSYCQFKEDYSGAGTEFIGPYAGESIKAEGNNTLMNSKFVGDFVASQISAFGNYALMGAEFNGRFAGQKSVCVGDFAGSFMKVSGESAMQDFESKGFFSEYKPDSEMFEEKMKGWYDEL